MTPQLIHLKSLPNVALVRMPELNGELELYYGSPTMDGSESIYLVEHVYGAGKKFIVKIGVVKDGNWRIVGMLSEVTDDDLINIIDVLVSSKSGKCLFPNFTGGPWKTNRIKSLDSAILAENWYFENPHVDPGLIPSFELERFRQAQSRVLDRSRCLLLGREGA